MSYFLASNNLQTSQTVIIDGDEARHITLSRRSKNGDSIHLQGPNGRRFEATITTFKKNAITCLVGKEIIVPDESPLQITLFQALINEQALDIVLQKATELGVTNIVLFPSKHSSLSESLAQKKLSRWNKITKEAAKQCDRAILPTITVQKNITEATKLCQKLDLTLVLDPSGKQLASVNKKMSAVGLVVGPEGGFGPGELELLSKLSKSQSIHLGPRILRAETTAIAGISLLQHTWGDM